jgi:hypothetical protein
VLERRVQGLSDICTLITRTRYREIRAEFRAARANGNAAVDETIDSDDSDDDDECTRWLTSDFLAKWALDSGLVELLYSSSAHQQLLSRCDDVLLLLGRQRRLSRAHLAAVWAVATGAFESMRTAVYATLARLVATGCLDDELTRHFFDLLRAAPAHQLSVETVQLIHRLTKSALKLSGTAEGLGSPLMGSMAIDFLASILIQTSGDAGTCAASDADAPPSTLLLPLPPSPPVLQAAVTTLCAILIIPGFEGVCRDLIQYCTARMCAQAGTTLVSADLFSLFGALSRKKCVFFEC